MPNTSLPTGLNANTTGHVDFHNTIHAEINLLSRRTGRRNLKDLLINGWAIDPNANGGGIHAEIIDDRVYLYIRGLDGTNATNVKFMNFSSVDDGSGISTRFAPYNSAYQSPVYTNGLSDDDRYIMASSTNGWAIYTPTLGSYFKKCGTYWRVFSWPTGDRNGWPSFLPPAV